MEEFYYSKSFIEQLELKNCCCYICLPFVFSHKLRINIFSISFSFVVKWITDFGALTEKHGGVGGEKNKSTARNVAATDLSADLLEQVSRFYSSLIHVITIYLCDDDNERFSSELQLLLLLS